MKISDEQFFNIARSFGLIDEQAEPINHTGTDTQTTKLPPYASDREKRIEVLKRALVQRDERVADYTARKQAADKAKAKALQAEGWSNEAEPPQSRDNEETPATAKKALIKFSDFRKGKRRKKAVEINPQISGLGRP